MASLPNENGKAGVPPLVGSVSGDAVQKEFGVSGSLSLHIDQKRREYLLERLLSTVPMDRWEHLNEMEMHSA
jgi:hypothetical protein